MKYFSSYYLIPLCTTLFILFSCTREVPDIVNKVNTQDEILIRHKWRHFQTRGVTIDTTTNTVIQDSIVQVEACYQNSLFVFAADSVVKRIFQCFNPIYNGEGKWYLKADSTFRAQILERTSYGTGWIYTDFGIPWGKMTLLTENEFQVKSYSGVTFGNTVGYNTFYLKAEN